jgi:hypothetical protein
MKYTSVSLVMYGKTSEINLEEKVLADRLSKGDVRNC